ncbi:hypothetical protein AZH46_11590 [Corynebacterium striatum]|nr:hypothetical protein AZH46_11590 [Corynebacterium striatum]
MGSTVFDSVEKDRLAAAASTTDDADPFVGTRTAEHCHGDEIELFLTAGKNCRTNAEGGGEWVTDSFHEFLHWFIPRTNVLRCTSVYFTVL